MAVGSSSWGGARRGAGRPARGPIASEPHQTRPELGPLRPIHIRARLTRGLASVATRRAYQALRRAVALSLARSDFKIVQLAWRSRGRCVELVVEATDKHALARGMQGFQVSAARALNRLARRAGTVFPDRYRMAIVATRGALRRLVGTLRGMLAVTRPEARLTQQLWALVMPRRWMRTRADEAS